MELRTPLARVRGLGSARDGTEQFITQRLTAMALVPLLLWFVFELVALTGASHQTVVLWVQTPSNTVFLILLIFVLFYHLHIGLFEVLEDYVHSDKLKAVTMVFMKFSIVALTVTAVLAVLRIVFVPVGG
ncbi:MAG: succinate dehydrogenase, hydrophobic membrane anchor protein [Beggiatoa sp. IS2]|nr:MAG: succinate dehydrogenase, hydrophobic membrane anchor protein [Beggiatoa sp. IS2]